MRNGEEIPEQGKMSVLCVHVCEFEGESDKDRERTKSSSEAVAMEVDFEVVKMLCVLLFEGDFPNSFVL